MTLLALGAVLGFVAAAVFGYRHFAREPGPAFTEHTAVSWPEGLDAREAAALLADLGLTDSPRAMELYLRAMSAPDCFQPGPHLLPGGSSPQQLVAALCRTDDRPRVTVTIPEGFHRFAIAVRLEARGVVSREAFLHATANRELLYALGMEPAAQPEADTAEGYLFPATYELRLDSDPEQVVRRMVVEGNRRWQRLVTAHAEGWERLRAELGHGRREVLTLASIVEKEAAVDDERPIIASVFLNRMRDPELTRLQSDPTAVYGCLVLSERIEACRDFDGRATPALNRDPNNTYSTYVNAGLPPGPIASPGAKSIEAVLAPAETKYLFFVAKGQGRHAFSETYEQHTEAVRRWREQRRK